MHQHPTVARAAEGLGVAWHTANDAVPAKGKRVLIDHPDRLDGVTAIGVDQHVRRRTGRGDKHVTVIIDLTAIHDGTGPARLSDMVEGRSEQAFTTRPAERSRAWRDHRVEVIAMDGFTGFTTATTEGPLTRSRRWPPFHVVGLGGDGLDQRRRRIQRTITGRRGREDDPLHHARPALRTGADLLTDNQQDRLEALFAVDAHAKVEMTSSIHQRTIAAYQHADRRQGRASMIKPINPISSKAPTPPTEIPTPGRTLKNRAIDAPAHLDRPGTPNKPTETINDRLEHLRDSAPGSTSPTNHITRPPPETSGHRPRPHPNPEEPVWIQQKIMERASRRCRIAQRRSEPPLEAMISLYQSKDFLRYRASVPVPSSSRST